MKEYDQERYEVPDVLPTESKSDLKLQSEPTLDYGSSPNLTRYLSTVKSEKDDD